MAFSMLKNNQKYWTIETQYAWVALILTIIVPVFLGALSPFVLLVVSLLYFVANRFNPNRVAFSMDALGWVLLAILFTQIILAAISAQVWTDVTFGLNFLPLVLYVFAKPLLARTNIIDPIGLFSHIAFLGTLCAFAFGLITIIFLENLRANFGLVNVNDLAGLGLLFGFLPLVGFTKSNGQHRYYLLLGPVIALFVLLITGSRGAMLAYPGLLVISFWFLVSKKLRLQFVFLNIAALIIVIMISSYFNQIERVLELPKLIWSVVNGDLVTDSSTNARLILYKGGIQAFLDAPLFGHGWSHFMEATAKYIPDVDSRSLIIGLPQLHNDILSFAASGGVVGIATYLIALGAPLYIVWNSKPDAYLQARKLAVLLLVTYYFFRGLTDLMIGFEYGTTFYAMMLAFIFGFFRDRNYKFAVPPENADACIDTLGNRVDKNPRREG